MKLISLILLFQFSIAFISCSQQIIAKKEKETIIYQTENLIITKLSDQVYEHTSFLQTNDFGKVPCNGMVVVNQGEAVILDTPTDVESSVELIHFLQNHNITIKSVVATHFHEDCIGGLEEFHKIGVPSYSNQMTIDLLKGEDKNIPQNGIDNEFTLNVGNKEVYLNYFGEGHTKDNIIAYYPDEKTLFGGCLLKEMNATKGYLGDANEAAWSETVTKLNQKYPDIQIVIPGHGKRGGKELLDYTIRLFAK